MNKEAKLEMDVLKSIGEKELWLVECHITSQREKASTWQWVVYGNRDDALRWIRLCSEFHTGEDLSNDIDELKVGESDTTAYVYLDVNGANIVVRFIVTHYCGES